MKKKLLMTTILLALCLTACKGGSDPASGTVPVDENGDVIFEEEPATIPAIKETETEIGETEDEVQVAGPNDIVETGAYQSKTDGEINFIGTDGNPFTVKISYYTMLPETFEENRLYRIIRSEEEESEDGQKVYPEVYMVLDDIDESEQTVQSEFVTYGIYKSSEIQKDANGDYELATFTDVYGNDFVATITKDTERPEEFHENGIYAVTHDEIMTMSLPGIFPHVFRIEEADEMPTVEKENVESGIDPNEPLFQVPTTPNKSVDSE